MVIEKLLLIFNLVLLILFLLNVVVGISTSSEKIVSKKNIYYTSMKHKFSTKIMNL